jgi:cytochrome c oxidase assembly factor CtaG
MGDPIEISTIEISLAIATILFTIFLTIWMIALMYNAFKVSTNMKGSKSVIIFIVGLVVSIVITTLITSQLIQIFS